MIKGRDVHIFLFYFLTKDFKFIPFQFNWMNGVRGEKNRNIEPFDIKQSSLD